ncbi:MAG TPA: alanine racemase [Gammaproteobacteria bacterium]|nr:alanine racemase [Gammaproteobacteria bacterium]HAU23717.1 alanine racemase [Gammaproteobacteria bacterium]HCI88467.1 alanine racemase [Gammaproteobacteria bacterium]
MTRRRFLQTSTSAAALWIPASVNSYTHQEIQDLYVDGSMQANVSKWELDTPSLCVDLDALEANIATMQDTLTRNDIASRPHGKTHKSPTIARMQLDAGAIGICAAKVSEAEAMFQHGIDAVLMTTTNVTATKIRRAMNLRHANPQFIQATDSEQNARLLSEAAVSMGITADVVVDVDPGGHRTGITPGQPALALGQLIDQLPGLTLRGLLCYDGGSQHVKGFAARREQTLERLLGATDTFDLFNSSGLSTEIFSGGGTGSYNIDHETRGLTDVQVGSYVFMDAQYMDIGGADNDELYADFVPSLTIMTTVLNDQYPGRCTTDAGAKACTINRPWPRVKGEIGMSYTSGSDEFGTLRYEEEPSRTYKVGDKIELIVSHCDPVVNLYNNLYAVRGERVEAIWPIAARGMST